MKRILIFILYGFSRLFYKKRFLNGYYFSKEHYTLGWRMITKYWFIQKIIGINRSVPWPCSPFVKIGHWENIIFDNNDIDNFCSPGTYYQAINAKLKIGKGTKIAPGVGLITANHSFNNLKENADGRDIIIGSNCWIGMNAVILPGVVLGNHTIVGAGAVVTKSFKHGNCIIAGNPARLIKETDCVKKYNEEININ